MPIINDKDGRKEVSQEFFDTYISSLQNLWNKESHVSIISELHDLLLLKILKDHNYKDFAELNSWAQEPINEYYNEANAIKSWYRETWLLVEQYAEAATEQTAMSEEAFIETLPAFTFQQ